VNIQVGAIRTQAFKKLFGDSKVVNEDGSPMVVYHGAREDFDEFDIEMGDLGTHFGTKSQAARFVEPIASFEPDDGRIIPVYLNIKNPIRLIDYGHFGTGTVGEQLLDKGVITSPQFNELNDQPHKGQRMYLRRLLQEAGYDGVVYLNRREGVGYYDEDGDYQSGVDPEDANLMTDAEFLDVSPDAKDSYIVFSPTQIKSAIGNSQHTDTNMSNKEK